MKYNRNRFKINQKMNRSYIKLKLLALSLLATTTVAAQKKLTKTSQSINVDKEVTIDLNTSYCNIEFDTWNKNVVEIEAYVEGDDLGNEELKKALNRWGVDIDATESLVSIKTQSTPRAIWIRGGDHDEEAYKVLLKEMKFELAEMPDFDFDFDFEFDFQVPEPPEPPELPEMPPMPELPPLPKGIHDIHFDYEAYKKDGEKYLDQYSKEFEEKFGKDFAKKMEAWSEKFGEEWGEKYGEHMEAWGEQYARRMEQQADRIAQNAQRTAERNERLAEIHAQRAEQMVKLQKEREKMHKERALLEKERRIKIEKIIKDKSSPDVKKTIKIKMPKDAKLKVDVRHGELKFASNVDNLKANLSHSTLIAQSINGSTTSVNAAYSPVYVTDWNVGELNLKYAERVKLNNVRQLVLHSNSSNVQIEKLLGNAIIEGSIGNLKIKNIDATFSNLKMLLENTDAIIYLPKTKYYIDYKGEQSNLVHPEKKSNDKIATFNAGDIASNKNIVLKAKYSNVLMQ